MVAATSTETRKLAARPSCRSLVVEEDGQREEVEKRLVGVESRPVVVVEESRPVVEVVENRLEVVEGRLGVEGNR